MARRPLDILRTVFGFDSFRGLQAEIIDHVIAGGDALVLMPTGGGKSLCYQIPALCRPGVAIVVSPLIALMRDQVEALRQFGVRAAALNSALSFGAARRIEAEMHAGALDLVYVAPERLLTGAGLEERFGAVPRIAATATADSPTRRDIVERLGLGRVFAAGFDRPNIRYHVAAKNGAPTQLHDFIARAHDGDSGIVYCLTRAKVEDIAKRLAAAGHVALPYHAGLDKAVRTTHQDRFLKDEGVVIVATVAFGMGIDKPNVRFVAHLDPPKSLESYLQETGRAGRDGLASDAWMVYGVADIVKLRRLIANSEAPDPQKRIEYLKLDALLGFCETTRCRRQVLLEYFGETLAEPCGNCDTCLEPVASFDGTVAAQKALSCVWRTGQMFGAAHVIDVLLGKDTERVRRFRHGQLSTFGIGTEFGREEWRSVFRQLVAMDLLVVDAEGHGGLRMGPDCRQVLHGTRRVELRRDVARRSSGAAKPRAPAALVDAGDEALFQALRARRLALAKAQGVPPYVIFHDRTLVEIARARPRALPDLGAIVGIGKAKLERYGDDVLAVVSAHRGD